MSPHLFFVFLLQEFASHEDRSSAARMLAYSGLETIELDLILNTETDQISSMRWPMVGDGGSTQSDPCRGSQETRLPSKRLSRVGCYVRPPPIHC